MQKTYRSIARLDFPVFHPLVDRLGEYCEFLSQGVKKLSSVEEKVVFDPANRAIRVDVETDTYKFQSQLTLRYFYIDLLFSQGLAINQVSKNLGLELASGFVAELNKKGLKTFERIGFRNWLLAESQGISYRRVQDYIAKQNKPFAAAFTDAFAEPSDLAIVLEAQNSEETFVRMSLGPYQKSESAKYFPFPSPIDEGLVADIDVSQKRIDLPSIDLQKIVHGYQRSVNSVFASMENVVKQNCSGEQ